MRRISKALFLFLTPLLSLAQEQQDANQELRQRAIDRYEEAVAHNSGRPNVVRTEYHKDSSLPDGIALRHFLSGIRDLTELERSDAIRDLTDQFELLHDDRGRKRVNRLYDALVSSADALDLHIREMETARICSIPRFARTKEETYAVFTEVDDRRNAISEQHFRLMRSTLTRTDYELVVEYLDDLKTRLHHRSYDHAAFYAQYPNTDVRDRAEAICAQRSLGQ